MKKVRASRTVSEPGLQSLVGQRVLLLCANYFYTGKLTAVNQDFVTLKEPAIVYETGSWREAGYINVQALHTQEWYVQRVAIESFGVSK